MSINFIIDEVIISIIFYTSDDKDIRYAIPNSLNYQRYVGYICPPCIVGPNTKFTT